VNILVGKVKFNEALAVMVNVEAFDVNLGTHTGVSPLNEGGSTGL
jgi:hypothetical protein